MDMRGISIGIVVMILGFLLLYTFISPNFLFSIGVNIKTYNSIRQQFGIWWPVISVSIILSGLIAIGKFR